MGRPTKMQTNRRRIEEALMSIALGNEAFCVDTADERRRFPTVAERIKAIELLMRHMDDSTAAAGVSITLPAEIGEWTE